MEETIKGFSDGKAEMMSKIEMLDEVMVGECTEFGNANESLDLFVRSPLDTIVGDSVHFAEPVNDYCAEKNYKTIPKYKPTLPKCRSTTLIDMMQFVSDWFDYEKSENTFCNELGDRVADCDNSVQEKLVDCFDVVKNEEENDKLEFSISEVYRVKCMALPMSKKEEQAEDLGGYLSRLFVLIKDISIVKNGPHVEKRQAYAITRHVKFGPSKKGGAKKLKALGDASFVVRKASTSSPTIDPCLENEDQTFGQIVASMKFKCPHHPTYVAMYEYICDSLNPAKCIQLIKPDCEGCIEEEDEFLMAWNKILDEYDAHENSWLKIIFVIRVKWVYAYVRHEWYTGMNTT
ncbi:hypothetical protein LWI29_007361 [Acer saccharum]|uniref:Uncharacterized protein n=1 Tax=Acer saccharum TaxID=4024 RepID=A0AA39W6Q0_ACESA|nr:hypothetical protein LWI29_007361 [Acer saccharum]